MNLSKGTILLAVIVAMPAVTSCQHDTEILWKQMRKQIPVYNPESILIPAGKSSAQVSGAIRRSLLAKKWLLVKEEERGVSGCAAHVNPDDKLSRIKPSTNAIIPNNINANESGAASRTL